MTPKFQAPWVATSEDDPFCGETVLAILRRGAAPVVAVLDGDEGWMLAETPAHNAKRFAEPPIAWMRIPDLKETP
jgi:hypothetical protein